MTNRNSLLLMAWFASRKTTRRPARYSRRYLIGAVLGAVIISLVVWLCNQHLGTQMVDVTH